MDKKILELIEKLENTHSLTLDEYEYLITNKTDEAAEILAEKAGEPIEGWYEFELLGYVGMRVVEQKTGDYKQSVVQLPEEELKGILDEIEYGEFIDKDLSMEELKEAFPKFTERFIAENEEYDLEGKLAEMDWGM